MLSFTCFPQGFDVQAIEKPPGEYHTYAEIEQVSCSAHQLLRAD